jgi:hypothetical protein
VDIDGDSEIYVGIVHHAANLADPREPGMCLCERGEGARRPAPTAARRAIVAPKPKPVIGRLPLREAAKARDAAKARGRTR